MDTSSRRLMRRIYIDSQIEGATSVSRIDISLTSDFLDEFGISKHITPEQINSEFSRLHQENKQILAGIISEDMRQKIALNGE